jgi:hypothetical protein
MRFISAMIPTIWLQPYLTPAKLVSVQDGTAQPPAEVPATEQAAKQDETKPAETSAQATCC